MSRDDDEIPLITIRQGETNKTTNLKPLYKLKIKDLLEIPYDPENDCFGFKNKSINLVMCGGKIEAIFRDDSIFAFRMSDGTGAIQCFHKFKDDVSSPWVHNEFSKNLSLLSCEPVEETMFNRTGNDTILNSYEKETSEILRELKTWFGNEILDRQKIRDVEDTILVSGHLLNTEESVRKINVLDFRIIENSEEYQDFLLQVNYLYEHTY